jgi:hypothetical protein
MVNEEHSHTIQASFVYKGWDIYATADVYWTEADDKTRYPRDIKITGASLDGVELSGFEFTIFQTLFDPYDSESLLWIALSSIDSAKT